MGGGGERVFNSFVFFCQGYPRLLSGDMIDLTAMPDLKQRELFPQAWADTPWNNVNEFKRFFLSFPFYPFRTLCPRDLYSFQQSTESTKFNPFDGASPMFPANTQINIAFKKRDVLDFSSFMLPANLDPDLGTSSNELTAEQRTAALSYSVANIADPANPVVTNYVIKNVAIQIKDMYLQVKTNQKIKKKYFL